MNSHDSVRVSIGQMGPADLDFAALCTEREGWACETRAEFEGFLAHDPAGCLIAEFAGQPIGIAIATSYGVHGFVGEIIVVPEQRGRGLGRRLLEEAVAYLHGRGVANVYLDSVAAAAPLYVRAGFRRICRSLRFTGHLQGAHHPSVRPMKLADLARVCEADRNAFGADRSFFLIRRLTLYPDLCMVLEEHGRLAGYILGRRGRDLVSAGPWFASREVDRPVVLLEALALAAGEISIQVGVLERNEHAVQTIRSLDLEERPNPPWRMVLGSAETLGASDRLYAIGSAAKG